MIFSDFRVTLCLSNLLPSSFVVSLALRELEGVLSPFGVDFLPLEVVGLSLESLILMIFTASDSIALYSLYFSNVEENLLPLLYVTLPDVNKLSSLIIKLPRRIKSNIIWHTYTVNKEINGRKQTGITDKHDKKKNELKDKRLNTSLKSILY